MSDGFASAAAAMRIVCARSAAEMPVVTPWAASIDTVKFVPCDRAVLRDHRRQVEAPRVLGGDRHADQAAAVPRHEVDLFGRDEIGGEDEVALVLAVLLVDEHDHAPGLEVGDDLGNRTQGHGAVALWNRSFYPRPRSADTAATANAPRSPGASASAERATRNQDA